MSQEVDPALTGSAMHQMLDVSTARFVRALKSGPMVDLTANDVFQQYARSATGVFLNIVAREMYASDTLPADTDKAHLYDKFYVAQLGVGVASLTLELAPIVYTRDLPEEELTPDAVAETAANTYGFVDLVVSSGARVGPTIVNHFIKPGFADTGYWLMEGAVNGAELVKPDRVDKFEIAKAEGGTGYELRARNIDEAIRIWKARIPDPRENAVSCPAHIIKDSDNGEPYTKAIYDAMTEHARLFIYPDFIPRIQALVEQHG